MMKQIIVHSQRTTTPLDRLELEIRTQIAWSYVVNSFSPYPW